MPTKLAPHEALGVHEVLTGEVVGVTLLRGMLPLAGDRELKTQMERALQRRLARIRRLREFARAAQEEG